MYHIIKVMRMKPNDKIEVVYNHSTYLCELNENYEAVLKDILENNKSNDIPVVINEDGLVVYATEGIGRIVKVINNIN